MTEKWTDIKFPKDILYGMFCLLVSGNTIFIIYLYFITQNPRAGTGLILDIGVLFFISSVGWGASLFLYFRVPESIAFKENNLLLKRRITEKVKIFTKGQIHKVILVKSFASGEFGCNIHYNRKKPEYAIGIDFESGKKVYDWYYGHKEEDGPRPITNYYWRDKKKSR